MITEQWCLEHKPGQVIHACNLSAAEAGLGGGFESDWAISQDIASEALRSIYG